MSRDALSDSFLVAKRAKSFDRTCNAESLGDFRYEDLEALYDGNYRYCSL